MRKPTFAAAMEQSEQLFAAAEAVGPEARPLPLFYALSQAGRAIAAAFERDEDNWKLIGHGIAATALPGPLWDVRLTNTRTKKGQPPGSFQRVAELLDSPSLPKSVRLGDAFVSIPDVALSAPSTVGAYRALRVGYWPLRGQNVFGGLEVDGASQIAQAYLYGIDPEIWRDESDPNSAVASYLSTGYPTTSGVRFSTDEIRFHPHIDGTTGVSVHWLADGMTEADRFSRIRRMCVPLRSDNSLWIAPKLGTNNEPLHPLLAWWAVTFGLSMLARYEPDNWIGSLDVDQSTDAMTLETILDFATQALPDLILAVLTENP